MTRRAPSRVLPVLTLASTVVAAPQEDPRRAEMLAVAKRYAEFRWTPTKANVYHGLDRDGVRVDTPDSGYRKNGFRIGEVREGIPYQWGGFSSLEQFAAGIRGGKYAGHLPIRGSSRSSQHAVGVDCSGFVARCWDLPRKHSTRSIGNICYTLADFAELQPGDIINSFDGHVVLFVRFRDAAKTRFEVYEAGATGVRKSIYTLERLRRRGYKPLRYKPLDPSWQAQALAGATWTRPDEDELAFVPEAATPRRSLSLARAAFDAGRSGDWVRYDLGRGTTTTRAVFAATEKSMTIRTSLAIAGKVQQNELERSRKRSLARALVDFAGRDQRFGSLELRSVVITPGRLRAGSRTLPCRRIEAGIATTLLTRSLRYPITIRVTCLQSDAVPLSGILRAHFVYTLRRPGVNRPVEWGTVFQLRAYRSARVKGTTRSMVRVPCNDTTKDA